MRKVLFTLLFAVTCSYCYSTTQYYDSHLKDNVFTVLDSVSLVRWGYVYADYIELRKIKENKNGFIEFNIENTDYVEVSLTDDVNDAERFGFIFKVNSITTIQVAGIEILNLPTITYSYNDIFKVEKCGEAIYYYKNGERIYEYCLKNLAAEFVHTTHVTTAPNTRLKLLFESNINCLTPFNGGANQGLISDNSDLINNGLEFENRKDGQPNISSTKMLSNLPANQVVKINVYSLEGAPIKQFNIRTNSKGEVPKSHSIYKYTNSTFKIELATIKP